LPKNEPQPDKTPPTCPSWLSYQARAEWKRVVPELERMGLLTTVDRAALTGYCEAYARYVKAAKEIQKGFTYEYYTEDYQKKLAKKPECDIARDALNQVKAFCIEFGLTPSSRGKMTVPGGIPNQDPLDKMLGTGQN
jgi:P27 family predicted phage terminase small subunit